MGWAWLGSLVWAIEKEMMFQRGKVDAREERSLRQFQSRRLLTTDRPGLDMTEPTSLHDEIHVRAKLCTLEGCIVTDEQWKEQLIDILAPGVQIHQSNLI